MSYLYLPYYFYYKNSFKFENIIKNNRNNNKKNLNKNYNKKIYFGNKITLHIF